MVQVHRFLGFFVVGVFALGWIWGLLAKLVGRGPGELYWRWLAVAQVTALGQAILGTVLLVSGARVASGSSLSNLLHYVYGFLPLLLFAAAHLVARSGNLSTIGMKRGDGEEIPIRPWTPFAWASFIAFGLTLRALMTGLGVG